MAGKKQKQEGVGAWIAIVILFAVGLWPIALVMLAACWSTIEMMIWLGGVEPWYI